MNATAAACYHARSENSSNVVPDSTCVSARGNLYSTSLFQATGSETRREHVPSLRPQILALVPEAPLGGANASPHDLSADFAGTGADVLPQSGPEAIDHLGPSADTKRRAVREAMGDLGTEAET